VQPESSRKAGVGIPASAPSELRPWKQVGFIPSGGGGGNDSGGSGSGSGSDDGGSDGVVSMPIIPSRCVYVIAPSWPWLASPGEKSIWRAPVGKPKPMRAGWLSS
jgi:hypothetical protein